MVVCKFFLEGHCRFGSRCRFEHDNSYNQYAIDQSPDYSSERPSGTSVLRSENTSFGPRQDYRQQIPSQNASFGLKYSIHEVMQTVSRDMLQAETGNQWRLSVYSPLRDLPNLPGLEDQSPEELRWEYNKADRTNSVPIWQAIVQQMYANVAKIINELKKKDTGFAIIDGWLRGIEGKGSEVNVGASQTPSHFSTLGSGSVGNTQLIFGGSQANSSVFGGSSPSVGFGGSTTSPSLFGGHSFSSPGQGANNNSLSIFGGSNVTTTPVFGGNNNNNASVFGGSNSMTGSPGFGGINTSSSVFGGSTSNPMISPVFGGNNAASSIFGGGTSMTPSTFGGNNTSSSMFGGSNMTTPGFGGTNTNSVFGGENINNSSIFGVNNTTSPSPNNSLLFSQTQMQSPHSPFSLQATAPQQNHASSPMFANQTSAFSSNQTSSSPFSSNITENHHYSEIQELNENDLASFNASKFNFGSIPTKPPPKALCNV